MSGFVYVASGKDGETKIGASIKDEEFDRFSPQWDFDVDTHEPLLIKTNLGGLVNKAAFKSIATVQAKDASGAPAATEDDADSADCNKLSAAAHKATPHYLAWRDAVADMMAEPRRGEAMNGLFPG